METDGFAYLDDIMIVTETLEEHFEILREVFRGDATKIAKCVISL